MMFVGLEGASFEIFEELWRATDRAAGIVGAALLENQLDRALKSHLQADEAVLKDSFGNNGPLGTFSNKIKIGYLAGIYGIAAYREFNLLRKIRNVFAHDLTIRSFKVSPVREYTANLKLVERYVQDTSKKDSRTAKPQEPTPVKDWPYWFAVAQLEEILSDPRKRFQLTLGVLSYGLSLANRRGVAAPYF